MHALFLINLLLWVPAMIAVATRVLLEVSLWPSFFPGYTTDCISSVHESVGVMLWLCIGCMSVIVRSLHYLCARYDDDMHACIIVRVTAVWPPFWGQGGWGCLHNMCYLCAYVTSQINAFGAYFNPFLFLQLLRALQPRRHCHHTVCC